MLSKRELIAGIHKQLELEKLISAKPLTSPHDTITFNIGHGPN
jgi:hypothetical protein